ncbi:MAG TPA: amino acid adenylation domain-containing protein [Candidatus Angelobacter sp.]|nr:amino acid adenylation domain-containing protein [Candidatus Angelobacter sp.]
MKEGSLTEHALASVQEAELSDAKRKLLQRYLAGMTAKRTLERAPNRALEKPLPLSFAQQQVWLHSQMAGDVPFYNETITVYRHGTLDVGVLERCLVEIIRRHEIWRTTFDLIAGQPVQIVQLPPETFPTPFVDLSHLPQEQRESEAARLATNSARRPFDLKTGPLLRILAVRIGQDEHRLYMTIHQIIFDAVTAYRAFLPELAALYEAFASGKPSPLPEPAVQYGDFAYWQRTKASPEEWSEHAAYWREHLVAPPTLQWPTDRPRPAIDSHRGAIQRFALPVALVRELRTFSRHHEVSPYMILVAAMGALLHRYTAQDDLVIGTFTAGRKLAEVELLLGYFVNPLALRMDLSGNPTFVELLRRVRTVVLDALKHEDLPFAEVVRESRWKPDISRNPLFQVVLSQQPKLAALPPGWGLATEEICNGGSKLDLMIVVDDRGDSISGPITYNPDLFDDATIQRLVGHWQTLLAGVVSDPQQPVATLPLLSEEEKSKLLVEWNDTASDFPADACVHHLFEAQVKRTPDAVAVMHEQDSLTYRELDCRANQLANYLREAGVGPDVSVGICLERSTQMMVGLLGTLKAGGAYVPLDPEYPKERLVFMMQDSGLRCLITESSLEPRLSDCGRKVVYIDRDWTRISRGSRQAPSSSVSSEDLAYVIYTSGSTGKPKGVQICHRALVNLLTSMQAKPGLTQKDWLLAVTTISFDIAALELYLPLTVGACCVLASRESCKDGRQLWKMLDDHDITVMQATPSGWKLLVDAAWPGKPNLKILCGGEAMPRDLAHELIARASSVWNMYGPTETTVWSAVHLVTAADSAIPIGRPIANTTMYVLDRHLQPVPVGVTGDLYIGGEGLARGYLNRPELNAEKFIPGRFRNALAAWLYKTGDLARYRADGNIECLGRTDTQVKVRGFRIELEEIESTLRRHPAVTDACAMVREDSPGDLRLAAYVTPTQQPAAMNEIRGFLKEHLPPHMIPMLLSLDKLPLTPNGKLNRNALPGVNGSSVNHEKSLGEELTDPVEQLLARIWTETLNVPRVSVYDNFFDLGGHSLLATQMVARLEQELGLRIKAKELAFQTLGQFAASCREKLQSR